MGKIELDHTGSGSGVTLSSDGTDLLLDGTAIGGGGGGADLYAANPVSATDPIATGNNSVSIGSGASSDGTDAIAIGTGADAGSGVAIGKNTETSALAATAIGSNMAGTGAWGAGFGSIALGASRASNSESFAVQISSNSSSYGARGANSIAMGYQAKATSEYSVSFGPSNNVTAAYSGAYGRGNTVSGSGTGYAFGSENTVSSGSAFAFGSKASAATNKFAFSISRFSSNGDAQEGKYILRSDTTNATSEALTTNNSTPFSNNQVNLPDNSAYAFHGTIVARQEASDGTACAAWKVEGLIRREANAGTTVLVNSATTVLDNTPNWGMALSADTTNGGLAITCTGAASTDIRWVATIHTSEVTYA